MKCKENCRDVVGKLEEASKGSLNVTLSLDKYPDCLIKVLKSDALRFIPGFSYEAVIELNGMSDFLCAEDIDANIATVNYRVLRILHGEKIIYSDE